MKVVEPVGGRGVEPIMPESLSPEITGADEEAFLRIISTDLSEEQEERIIEPPRSFPEKRAVLGVHWHPEFIPMNLIRKRIDAFFPCKEDELLIPTQHNDILSFDSVYSGIEIDCYDQGFNQKVQLLIHARSEKLERANVLRKMAAYTARYRSSQLVEFMDSIIRPMDDRINEAAQATGAGEALIEFVTINVQKVHDLIVKHEKRIVPIMVKNKLLRDFFNEMRPVYGNSIINRSQTFLQAVKGIVKREFPLHYFYRASEVIEEARGAGACIVIPHPEQFWPILLADYDVDGIEVWNPQSRKYTDFLISVIVRKNGEMGKSEKKLLVFMGDDTHMGEKIKDPAIQDQEKAAREIGLQPPWDDLAIKKGLILAGMSLSEVMAEYRSRLD